MTSLRARLLGPLSSLALVLFAGQSLRCGNVQCLRNSDCDLRASCVAGTCVAECQLPRDCPAERPMCDVNGRCVANNTTPDAGPDVATVDAAPDRSVQPDVQNPPDVRVIDVVAPPDVQAPPDVRVIDVVDVVTPPDVPVTGTGAYLDTCTDSTGCASGMCTGFAPFFCTRSCTNDSGCAAGQICLHNVCTLDDTGAPGCDPSTAAPCRVSCFGNATAAHCTRPCNFADDCPSGFACSPLNATQRVCVEIERPCTTADQCPSGLGFCGTGAGAIGCTARCATAADCPSRLPGLGLPPYTCEARSGVMVCVPPSDVTGSDPAGATCPATGTNSCRSAACDTSNTPPSCVENCTVRGGCVPGQGCFPELDPTQTELVCHPAGSRWVNQACSRASDCFSALCLPTSSGASTGYCTRNCTVDDACPTGMSCLGSGGHTPDGTLVRLCQR